MYLNCENKVALLPLSKQSMPGYGFFCGQWVCGLGGAFSSQWSATYTEPWDGKWCYLEAINSPRSLHQIYQDATER